MYINILSKYIYDFTNYVLNKGVFLRVPCTYIKQIYLAAKKYNQKMRVVALCFYTIYLYLPLKNE